jgi:hypothetical protein
MNSLLAKLTGKKTDIDYSSVMVVYQTPDKSWRGFVVPFDITFEADTKKEVVQVLNDMIHSYVEGLKKYEHPAHLTCVPLSYQGDASMWSRVSIEVFSKLRQNIRKQESVDYYAEAQVPA